MAGTCTCTSSASTSGGSGAGRWPRSPSWGRAPRTPAGLAPIEGVVDYVAPDFLGVRADDGLYRFIRGFDGSVAVGHHLYAGDVDARRTEQAWQAWLGRLFDAG